jgi:hypothetical protein
LKSAGWAIASFSWDLRQRSRYWWRWFTQVISRTASSKETELFQRPDFLPQCLFNRLYDPFRNVVHRPHVRLWLANLAAFYLLYRAILVTGLMDPRALIFRDFKQAEEALRKVQAILEERVRERTAESRASEEKYRTLIECANNAVFIHEIKEDGMPGPFLEVNKLARRQLGQSS